MAYFARALKLTVDKDIAGIPLVIDPGLVNHPAMPSGLNLKDRFTTTSHYLKPMSSSVPEIAPQSIAIFNGKLDLRRLKWWQVLFVLTVAQGKPGDFRDWNFIHKWASELVPILSENSSDLP